MNLEVLHESAQGVPKTIPILFIHGAWHGAWCWQPYFMPYFASQGYDCFALSLRGHAGSEGREALFKTSLADYVDDVARVADDITAQTGQRPILIGHSMGGLITMKALERMTAPAAVLLAPIPVRGFIPAMLRQLLRKPARSFRVLTQLSPYMLVNTPESTRDMFFSPDIPRTDLLRYFERIQPESFRVLLDVTLLDLPRPDRVRVPVQVLGAGNDSIFTPYEIKATATAYRAAPVMFENMAHDMMLEPEWQRVADAILSWLVATGSSSRRA